MNNNKEIKDLFDKYVLKFNRYCGSKNIRTGISYLTGYSDSTVQKILGYINYKYININTILGIMVPLFNDKEDVEKIINIYNVIGTKEDREYAQYLLKFFDNDIFIKMSPIQRRIWISQNYPHPDLKDIFNYETIEDDIA